MNIYLSITSYHNIDHLSTLFYSSDKTQAPIPTSQLSPSNPEDIRSGPLGERIGGQCSSTDNNDCVGLGRSAPTRGCLHHPQLCQPTICWMGRLSEGNVSSPCVWEHDLRRRHHTWRNRRIWQKILIRKELYFHHPFHQSASSSIVRYV